MIDRYTGLLTDEQWIFSQRVQKYKIQNKIRFLANSEILKMIIEFGYRKVDKHEETGDMRDWDGTGIPGKL